MILTVTLNPSVDVWLCVDTLRPGAFHRAAAVTRSAGGKGVNVSRVLRALGCRSTALTPAGPSRRNYKIITRAPRASTEINTPGLPMRAATLRRLERRLYARLGRVSCVVLSGSLPPGVPQTIYSRWIAAAKHRGTAVALDASGAALRGGLAAKPWLVKPNQEEAEALLGRRLRSRRSVIAAVRALWRRGPEVVLLSLGPRGAVLGLRATGDIWQAVPPAIRAVSTVGSGDALLAGWLAAWRCGAPPSEALRAGVACGTASSAAEPGVVCRPARVARLLPAVRLQRLVRAG